MSKDTDKVDLLINTQPTIIIRLTTLPAIAYHCVVSQVMAFSSYWTNTRNLCKPMALNTLPHLPIYWSRSYGKAEAVVSDAKSTLKKSDDIYLALLNIWNTTPFGHSFSPDNIKWADVRAPRYHSPSIVYSEITLCNEKCAQPPEAATIRFPCLCKTSLGLMVKSSPICHHVPKYRHWQSDQAQFDQLHLQETSLHSLCLCCPNSSSHQHYQSIQATSPYRSPISHQQQPHP